MKLTQLKSVSSQTVRSLVALVGGILMVLGVGSFDWRWGMILTGILLFAIGVVGTYNARHSVRL